MSSLKSRDKCISSENKIEVSFPPPTIGILQIKIVTNELVHVYSQYCTKPSFRLFSVSTKAETATTEVSPSNILLIPEGFAVSAREERR